MENSVCSDSVERSDRSSIGKGLSFSAILLLNVINVRTKVVRVMAEAILRSSFKIEASVVKALCGSEVFVDF